MFGLHLGLQTNPVMGGFVGALDEWESSISRLWCPGKRLLSSWSGDAGTLRETTGSSEATIGYLGGYFDTTAASDFITGAGASSAAWKTIYEQKGSGDNLSQTTAASQPLYVSSHSGFNNRACVHLDDHLTKGMPATLDVVRPYTIMVIEDDDGTIQTLRTVSAYTGTATLENNLICSNRSGLTFYRLGTVSTTQTATPCVAALTGPSSGNHVAYCNGTDITTASMTSGDWRKISLGKGPGGTEGARTKVFALIVFNKALSAGEITALQTILAPATL